MRTSPSTLTSSSLLLTLLVVARLAGSAVAAKSPSPPTHGGAMTPAETRDLMRDVRRSTVPRFRAAGARLLAATRGGRPFHPSRYDVAPAPEGGPGAVYLFEKGGSGSRGSYAMVTPDGEVNVWVAIRRDEAGNGEPSRLSVLFSPGHRTNGVQSRNAINLMEVAGGTAIRLYESTFGWAQVPEF